MQFNAQIKALYVLLDKNIVTRFDMRVSAFGVYVIGINGV